MIFTLTVLKLYCFSYKGGCGVHIWRCLREVLTWAMDKKCIGLLVMFISNVGLLASDLIQK